MNEWIIPFKGRNKSGAYNVNFLWHTGSTYIMDNHRAALWCWLQHISGSKKYNLIHIDRHYDTLYSQIEAWKAALPKDLQSLSINDYLKLDYNIPDTNLWSRVIRWDNYLSLFLELYPKNIDEVLFVTHMEGNNPPRWQNMTPVYLWNLLKWDYLYQGEWIANIDIDYFFCDGKENKVLAISLKFIEDLFRVIAGKINDGTISVLTISLSPELCGGWKPAEEICSKISEILNLPFSLP